MHNKVRVALMDQYSKSAVMQRSLFRNARILIVLVVAGLVSDLVTFCQAEEVYRWEDEHGVIHYSSEPQTKNDKPADLPRITRGRLGLQAQALQSCSAHGDIDCQAGADVDGSVICADGFRDASTRFRLHCNTPKLSIADIGDPKPDGKFSILVRNSKAVAAENPEVILRMSQMGVGIILQGPKSIAPFEVGEFLFDPTEYGALESKPNPAQVTITCSNCD